MVAAVKSAPDGTGAKGASSGVYQNIQFLMTKMDQWIHDCVIGQRCPRTGLDIVSCSGCEERRPQHFSIPLRRGPIRVVTPHAHELPRALRAQMEEIVAILERI